jgi:hypothetical protein
LTAASLDSHNEIEGDPLARRLFIRDFSSGRRLIMPNNVMRGSLPAVRWSAVFAGAAVALAVQICMGLFGASLGYAAEARDSRAAGVLAVLWSLCAAFTASLLGALVAARLVAATDSRAIWFHGALVWCFGLIAGVLLLSGTLAATFMGAGYAWEGGVLRDTGPGAPLDSAAGDAALASLLGAVGALFGLAGAVTGATIGRQMVTLAGAEIPAGPREGRATRSSLMPPPVSERREGAGETLWSDPAFDRRRTAGIDRRHH